MSSRKAGRGYFSIFGSSLFLLLQQNVCSVIGRTRKLFQSSCWARGRNVGDLDCSMRGGKENTGLIRAVLLFQANMVERYEDLE